MADHHMDDEKNNVFDVEQNMDKPGPEMETKEEEVAIIEDFVTGSKVKSLLTKLASGGVEIRGLEPVPPEARTHTKYYNIMTLFGGSFLSILPYVPEICLYLELIADYRTQTKHWYYAYIDLRTLLTPGDNNDYHDAADLHHSYALHLDFGTTSRHETICAVPLRIWVSQTRKTLEAA